MCIRDSPSPASEAPDAGVSAVVSAGDADARLSLPLQSFTVTGDPGKPPPPPCVGRFCDSTMVVGSLPAEAVQRVIHLNLSLIHI